MRDKNYILENNLARYTGRLDDAFFIHEAAQTAQREAATATIFGFEASLPNSAFDEHGVYAELKARGFKILRSEEGATVVGLRFTRSVSIAVAVEQRPQPIPSEPMDLSRRRVL